MWDEYCHWDWWAADHTDDALDSFGLSFLV